MQLIADSVLRLADADVAILVLPADARDFLDVVVAAGEAADQLTGMSYPRAKSLVELALQTGRGVRVGRLEDHHDLGVHLREVVRVSAVMAVPCWARAARTGRSSSDAGQAATRSGRQTSRWLKPSPIRPLWRRSWQPRGWINSG